MNTLLSLISITLLTFNGFVFSPMVPKTSSAEKWVAYKSEEGKVKMKFPAEYTVEEEDAEDHKVVKIASELDGETFFLSYTIHETPLEDHYEMANVSLNAFVGAFDVEPQEVGDFVYKDQKGRGAVLLLEDRGAVITYKALLIGQIQYQLVVVQEEGADEKIKEKFLKSFKLVK